MTHRFVRLASLLILGSMASCGDKGTSSKPGVQGPPPGSEIWSKMAPGAGRADGYGIAQSPSGEIAVVGAFDETAGFGGDLLTSRGGSDVFVAKLDAAGGHVWSKSFGDDQGQLGIAVELVAGSVVFGGDLQGSIDLGGGPLTATPGGQDAFVGRLDAAGAHMWSRRYGADDFQSLSDLAVDQAGSVYATGINRGTIDFGDGPLTSVGKSDVWLAKLDVSGKPVWGRDLGGDASESPAGIAVDASGNVYLVGVFFGTLDLGGGPMVPDEGDVFVLKLDAAGKHVWSKRFGGPHDQTPSAVAVDAAGNVYFAGASAGPTDFGGGPIGADASLFVVRLDTNGNHMWSKSFAGGADREIRSIAVDGDANVLFTGSFNGSLDLGGGPLVSAADATGADVFVAKLDSAGQHLWSKSGHSTGIGARGIAVDGRGNPAIVGGFSAVVDFGTRLTGGPDIRPFFTKLDR